MEWSAIHVFLLNIFHPVKDIIYALLYEQTEEQGDGKKLCNRLY